MGRAGATIMTLRGTAAIIIAELIVVVVVVVSIVSMAGGLR
jgi:hypothetical protein